MLACGCVIGCLFRVVLVVCFVLCCVCVGLVFVPRLCSC